MMKSSTTLILILIAAVLGIAAIFAVPSNPEPQVFDDVGELFFPDLDDPYASREIEVFETDPTTGAMTPFNVKFEQGLWRIPSHHGHPADAVERLANVTASLIGLKKDKIVSDRLEDQAATLTEDPLNDASSIDGRGKRIRLKDGAGQILADLIVGKKVEGENKRDWAYIRLPDSKRIYEVNLRQSEQSRGGECLADISTTFGDWIDTDLLRLESSSAITEIDIFNYSVNEETRTVGAMDIISLSKNDETKWEMKEIAEESELKDSAVRDLTSALDQLEIAGVRPKPPPDSPNPLSMASKGFFIDGEQNIYGNEGHLEVACEDGVVYFVYFGEVIYGSEDTVTAGTAEAGSDSPDDRSDASPMSVENRYIYVDVDVDPALMTPPPEAVEPPADDDGADTEDDGADTEDDGADTEDAGADTEDAGADTEESGGEKEKSPAEKAREEWQDKLDKAKARVAELRVRFDKWYYVISGESFSKLHVSRPDLTEAKLPDTSKLGEQPPEGRTPLKRPSGLSWIEIEYGRGGDAAAEGDAVKVLYTGWLKDGTEFDKNDDRDDPFVFTLGEGSVIKGWEEGITGMRPGGKRKLIIPPELGYGAAGAGGDIPPDATLVFDVELLEVEKKDTH